MPSSRDGDSSSSDKAPIPRQSSPPPPPHLAMVTAHAGASIAAVPSPRPKPALDHASAPTTPPRRTVGILKGTGPELEPGSARRARAAVTYNIKELSHKTRVHSKTESPIDSSSKESEDHHRSTALRRHTSGPPVYNLKDLIQQTRDMATPTRKLANRFLKKFEKDQKRVLAHHAGDEDGRPAKRRRFEDGSGISDPVASRHAPETEELMPTDATPADSSPAKEDLIKLVTPIICDGGISNPREILALDIFSQLLTLPQLRPLVWNPNRQFPWMFTYKIDIISLLVQVTGEQPPSPCTKCRSGRGQFTGCFVMSSKIDPGNVYGCANCVYHGRQTFCSIKAWAKRRPWGNAPGPALKDADLPEQSEEVGRPDGDGPKTRQAQALVTTDDNILTSSLTRSVIHGEATGLVTRSTPPKHQNMSLLAVGTAADSLHMEPWERAPGRIRSRTSGRPESEFCRFYAQGRYLTIRH